MHGIVHNNAVEGPTLLNATMMFSHGDKCARPSSVGDGRHGHFARCFNLWFEFSLKELMANRSDLNKFYSIDALDCQIACKDAILPQAIKNLWDSSELFREYDTPDLLNIVISSGMDACFPIAQGSA